jgi:hypothetical protein
VTLHFAHCRKGSLFVASLFTENQQKLIGSLKEIVSKPSVDKIPLPQVALD